MNAEIISVGTELLLGSTVDTNAAFMGEALAAIGVSCTNRQTVGDNLGRLTDAIRLALSRSDIVILIGGLGPTQDDLTRDGIAAALNDPLILDEGILSELKAIFAGRGLRWVESNSRQAMRPSCGVTISNQMGTAPGLFCEKSGKIVVALPGPPREFNPMAKTVVQEYLARHTGGTIIHSKVVRVCGLGESRVEELIRDLIENKDPTVAPYAKTGEVHLRVTARGQGLDEASAKIEPMVAEIRRRLSWHVYGFDDQALEDVVVAGCKAQGYTIAVAESCTAGNLGGRIANVAGASSVFEGGVICYSNEVKTRELGISLELLDKFSAVSEPVASQMAESARTKFGTHFGISVTGVAGPGSDDRGNPEGLVFVGLASENGTRVEKLSLGKGRDGIRIRAVQWALTTLWRELYVEANSPESIGLHPPL